MRITEIEIDDRNEVHLTSHGISIVEVQQVVANHPDVRQNRKNLAGTHVARGRTSGGRTVVIPVRRSRRGPGSADHCMGNGHMNDYDTAEKRRGVEADLELLPVETSVVEDISTVVSVRLRGDELAAVERAARAADMPLSTFIRQAALQAASPLDVRAVSARAEAIQIEARKLVALLHGDVALEQGR